MPKWHFANLWTEFLDTSIHKHMSKLCCRDMLQSSITFYKFWLNLESLQELFLKSKMYQI